MRSQPSLELPGLSLQPSTDSNQRGAKLWRHCGRETVQHPHTYLKLCPSFSCYYNLSKRHQPSLAMDTQSLLSLYQERYGELVADRGSPTAVLVRGMETARTARDLLTCLFGEGACLMPTHYCPLHANTVAQTV